MSEEARPPRPLTTRRAVLRGVAAGLVGALGLEALNVLAGPNVHTVIPGAAYRSAQLSPERLERLIKTNGIRTVVNFRGMSEDARWFNEQCRVTSRNGVSEEDISGSSAGRLPSVHTIRELVEILDRSEYPILFHCNRGIDRTGMASAIVLLLKTDTPLAEARKQLGLRFGHLCFGRTGNIDRFFDLYEEWLAANGQTHSPALFHRWLTEDYCPGPYRAEITPLDPPRIPAQTACGFRVRCKNTSHQPWRFRPGGTGGIHAIFYIDAIDGRRVGGGHSGLFDAVVAPGDGIDLTLAIPALEPGTYTLRTDMIDEQHGAFLQVGSEPLFLSLEVR